MNGRCPTAENAAPTKRLQIAVLANIYRAQRHLQHIVDLILGGYGWGGIYHHPPMDVVLLFVDQGGEGDPV